MDPGLAGFGQFLVVLAESSAPGQQGQCALHYPTSGQYLEVVAVRTATHHLQQPSASRPSPRDQLTGIGGVSPDDLEPREPAQQSGQHQLGSVPVLDTGGMHHHREEQPRGVHYDMALASRHPFARVIAARPPFSVVFTDWLSMMARWGWHPVPRSPGPWGAAPPQPAPKCRLCAISGSTTRQCPKGAGHGASFARVCRHANVQYAVNYLPQVRGTRMAPGCIWGQQGFQKAPLGIGQIGGI